MLCINAPSQTESLFLSWTCLTIWFLCLFSDRLVPFCFFLMISEDFLIIIFFVFLWFRQFLSQSLTLFFCPLHLLKCFLAIVYIVLLSFADFPKLVCDSLLCCFFSAFLKTCLVIACIIFVFCTICEIWLEITYISILFFRLSADYFAIFFSLFWLP